VINFQLLVDDYSINVLNQNENDGVRPANHFKITSYVVLAVGDTEN
jgi:hypothetical protein